MNVFWIRNGAAVVPTAADFEAFIQNVSNLYHDKFVTGMSSSLTFDGVHGLYYGASEIDLGIDVPDGRQGGHNTSVDLSANAALGVSWQVQQHYRGGHPRTYFPGVKQDLLLNANTWTAATIADWHTRSNDFNNQINSLGNGAISGPRLGVVSFQLRNEWRTPPVFRDFVNGAAVVDSRVDSMRRRLGPDR